MSARPAPRIGFSLEYILWIFIRISGLFMILFALIGIAGAFWMEARLYFQNGEFVDIGTLARWAFFPISTHVSTLVPDAAAWSHAWWQIMQYLMLFFAVTHGLNGVRQVIEDYVGGTWLRVLLRGVLFLLWMFILLVGWQLIQGNIIT
jgi:succinate dehydrogenase hydrophobic anchor subunit